MLKLLKKNATSTPNKLSLPANLPTSPLKWLKAVSANSWLKSLWNGQAFVMNPDQTVAQFAKENGTEVVSFVRYKVGDGIEKAVVDYAAEVAAAAKV